MKIRHIIANLFKVAFLGACVYGVIKWQDIGPQNNEEADFAERACVDEIGARYNVSNIRPVSTKKSPNGFVVRASVKTTTGTPAMAVCLANTHGGVRDVTINER